MPTPDEALDAVTHTGRCLCGGVTYRILGPLRDVTACHCSQCRRTSGHYAAMASAPTTAIEMLASASLRWFRSSPMAERGFCTICGGNIFWREIGGDQTSITAGTLDLPTQLKIARHIFIADKGDYYALDDDAPQFAQG
jgi:hypothetical protein